LRLASEGRISEKSLHGRLSGGAAYRFTLFAGAHRRPGFKFPVPVGRELGRPKSRRRKGEATGRRRSRINRDTAATPADD